MLERGLLGGGEDGLHVLADVQDDRPRLDPVDGAGDHLALAARELVEDHVAFGLAKALEDDLLGGLGADPAEDVAIKLFGLDEVADLGARLVGLRLLDRHLGEFVLDLADHAARAVHPDLAGLGVDPDLDVLVAGDPRYAAWMASSTAPMSCSRGSASTTKKQCELEECTNEIMTHVAPSRSFVPKWSLAALKETWGSPTSRRAAPFSCSPSIYPGGRCGPRRRGKRARSGASGPQAGGSTSSGVGKRSATT